MMAQLSDPREKLSITATVDGTTNSDYRLGRGAEGSAWIQVSPP